jgi:hypothetical protein
MDCSGANQEITIPQGDSAPYCIALPYFAPGATRGESCEATIPCYLYEVSGNDGTSNKGSFEFSYTNCDGTVINTSVVNTRTITVCARVDTVTSESESVSISVDMGVCTQNPPTATPLPQLYEFFISNGANSDNGHCDQNQLMTMSIFSISNTIPFMLNTVIYDSSEEPFNGNGLYYAVSVTSGDNTNNQPYYVILVNSAGEVNSVSTITNCDGPGNSQ